MYNNDIESDFFLRAWQIINEISDQLSHNNKFAHSLVSQAEELKAQAKAEREESPSYNLRRFNVDISKETLYSDLERTNAQIIIENHTLHQENRQLSQLLKEYEQTMEVIMSKFHSHTLAAQQHEHKLVRHYETLLSQGSQLPISPASNPALAHALYHLDRGLRSILLSMTGKDPATQLPLPYPQVSQSFPPTQHPIPLHASQPYTQHQPPGNEGQPYGIQWPSSEGAGYDDAGAPARESEQLSSQDTGYPSITPYPPNPYPPNTYPPNPYPISASSEAPPPPHLPSTSEPEPRPPAEEQASRTSVVLTLDTEEAEPSLDWAEARELEIARLEAENAFLRAKLDITPEALRAAKIPDDPEMYFVAQSSSAPLGNGSGFIVGGGGGSPGGVVVSAAWGQNQNQPQQQQQHHPQPQQFSHFNVNLSHQQQQQQHPFPQQQGYGGGRSGGTPPPQMGMSLQRAMEIQGPGGMTSGRGQRIVFGKDRNSGMFYGGGQ